MTFKLTYYVGTKVLQEWYFHSKALAYWKKRNLIETGRFQYGKFKVTPI